MAREFSARDALADILPTVGTDDNWMDRIKITGTDPILPSKFLIGNAGAGVIGATGLAAAELWRLRTGRVQEVSVDIRAAAIGMRVGGQHLPFINSLVVDTGNGKLSKHIDLRNDAGRKRLQGLTRDADIFLQKYPPGSISGRRFSPEEVAEVRPGIIYVSVFVYGRAGPWSEKRGFESLVQCCTGMVYEDTGAEEIPRNLPAQLLEYITGYLAAFGAMTALARQAEHGGSYLVRLSLCQTLHWVKRLGRLSQNIDGITIPSLDDVTDLTMQSETPFGRVRHLAPIVGLFETPPNWSRPAVPLGTREAVWPD